MSTCVAFSPGTGRRKGWTCHFLRERGGRTPGMRAAGIRPLICCEPARGRGAEGPGRGRRSAAGLESAVAAARPPQPGGERGRAGVGAAGRGGGGDTQTARLEPCVRRRHAHTCPPRSRAALLAVRAERYEIELSIHSWACRARAAAAELSPGSLEDAPARPSQRRVPARTVTRTGLCRRLFAWRLRRGGLSLGSAARCTNSGGPSAGGPWAAPGERQQRNCKKVPNSILSPCRINKPSGSTGR